MKRFKSRYVSLIFEVEFVNGLPIIQNAHLRYLGYPKDVKLYNDVGVSDMSLMDLYNVLDASEEVTR